MRAEYMIMLDQYDDCERIRSNGKHMRGFCVDESCLELGKIEHRLRKTVEVHVAACATYNTILLLAGFTICKVKHEQRFSREAFIHLE